MGANAYAEAKYPKVIRKIQMQCAELHRVEHTVARKHWRGQQSLMILGICTYVALQYSDIGRLPSCHLIGKVLFERFLRERVFSGSE